MIEADLHPASDSRTNLSHADLSHANLSYANLSMALLSQAISTGDRTLSKIENKRSRGLKNLSTYAFLTGTID